MTSNVLAPGTAVTQKHKTRQDKTSMKQTPKYGAEPFARGRCETGEGVSAACTELVSDLPITMVTEATLLTECKGRRIVQSMQSERCTQRDIANQNAVATVNCLMWIFLKCWWHATLRHSHSTTSFHSPSTCFSALSRGF